MFRGTRFILRKKPSGTIISPVAHQVDREFRVLQALGKVEGFPVPRVYVLCMDAGVIGTAFYVSLLSFFLFGKGVVFVLGWGVALEGTTDWRRDLGLGDGHA